MTPHPESEFSIFVTRLADNGYLESRGSDFYSITDKGRSAVR